MDRDRANVGRVLVVVWGRRSGGARLVCGEFGGGALVGGEFGGAGRVGERSGRVVGLGIRHRGVFVGVSNLGAVEEVEWRGGVGWGGLPSYTALGGSPAAQPSHAEIHSPPPTISRVSPEPPYPRPCIFCHVVLTLGNESSLDVVGSCPEMEPLRAVRDRSLLGGIGDLQSCYPGCGISRLRENPHLSYNYT